MINMNTWFKQWKEDILKRKPDFSESVRLRYSTNKNLDHYETVAQWVLSAVENPSLVKAAFLHGFPVDEAMPKLHELIDDEVVNVLEILKRLNSLDPNVPETARDIETNVLPYIENPGAIYVYVVSKLHHIDPDKKLFEWTGMFRTAPSKLSGIDANIHFEADILKLENAANFCRLLSKTSAFLNLRTERNVFDNAALLFENPQHFHEIVAFCSEKSDSNNICDRFSKVVEKTISAIGPLRVDWEWKHVGTLARKLPENSLKPWERYLYKTGFVTVVCDDKEKCYRALYLLHNTYGCRPNQLRDYIGENRDPSYKAIHTHLNSEKELSAVCQAIPVRIIPGETEENRRFQPFAKSRHALKNKPALGLVQTFTPDGKLVELQSGSTVLDFACKFESRCVAFFAGATVNGLPVDDIFHPLVQGDVVYLKLSDHPVPLPNDWEIKVHPAYKKRIRKSFKKYYKPLLKKLGRNWLVDQLRSHGLQVAPIDMDVFVRDAGELLKGKHHPQPPKNDSHWREPKSEWWFQQFGLYASAIDGVNLPINMKITGETARTFLAELSKLVDQLDFDFVNDIDISEAQKKTLKSFNYCKICIPTVSSELVGTIHGEVLMLHRPGMACAEGGYQVSRRYKIPSPTFIVIETNNRIGISADILSVFLYNKIDIIEVFGGKVRDRGVFRIMTHHLGEKLTDDIISDIMKISDVVKVYPPNSFVDPMIEQLLPSKRRECALSIPSAPPYTVGHAVRTDSMFYGMENEKQELVSCLKNMIRGLQKKSITCFVHGPKRAGKTSMVLSFLRDMVQYYEEEVFQFYFEAPIGESWAKTKTQLKDALINSLEIKANRFDIALPSLKNEKLSNLILIAKRYLSTSLIFAIDEFTGLAAESYRNSDHEGLINFINDVRNIPECLLILIGPHAHLSTIPVNLQTILTKSHRIEVRNLDKENAYSLITVEKNKPRHRIHIGRSLFKDIYNMTGGNPYWLNLIGYQMWKISESKDEITSIYTRRSWELAFDKVLSDRYSFLGRLVFSSGLCGDIVICLAEIDNTPLSLPEFHDKLCNKHIGLQLRELENCADELIATGTICRMIEERGPVYKIEPPVLYEHIKRYGVN